jgi:predicted O-linked N-acetylglucosamine transferase (SPINDLY family)
MPPGPERGHAPAAEIEAWFQQALALHRQRRFAEAELLYRKTLAAAPNHAGSLHLLGVVHQQRGEHEQAAALIGRAIAQDSGQPAAHSNLGVSLHRLRRHGQALASFERALQLKPDHLEALINRGNTLREIARPAPALDSFRAALAIRADSFEALMGCGNALLDLGRHQQALDAFQGAAQLRADSAAAHVGQGAALRGLHRESDALASYDRALQLQPALVSAAIGRGNALQALGRHQESLACYDQVLAQKPELVEVENNRGAALRGLKRYQEAAAAFARLAAARPAFDYAASNRLHSALYCCDWQDYDPSVRAIRAQVAAGHGADVPFSFLAISGSAAEQLQCARAYATRHYPAAAKPLWPGRSSPRRDDRIHVAYLSSDFHAHATAYLMAELFERHDRGRFRISAISFGPSADDRMRQRLLGSFDEFVDVRQASDLDAAMLVQAMAVDIAVDLKGFTTGNRAGILAHRPAPIQVSYLGYPGTMGAPYIDYLIADRLLIPEHDQACYAEQVVYLPDSYQVNDGKRPIAAETPSRAEAGLPERGFIFCCFNNNYKITPEVFGVWMRLLHQVPGSVLWLLEDNADAARNLRTEAGRRDIEPTRLVFAGRLPLERHLARQRLADLFLDTLPCNAHTTASDALWAGLPVLTCLGGSFAGRVAASLLSALGLPELVCSDLAQYEALALRLATRPGELAAIAARLADNRPSSPLFDSERFRRHLEAAYLSMFARHLQGQAPLSFAVPPAS